MRFNALASSRNSRLPPKDAFASKSPLPTRFMKPISFNTGVETDRAIRAASNTAINSAPAAAKREVAWLRHTSARKSDFRRHGPDYPNLIVTNAKRGRAMRDTRRRCDRTRSDGTIRKLPGGIGSSETRPRNASTSGSLVSASVSNLPGRPLSLDLHDALGRMSQQCLVGRVHEEAGIWAHRQPGNECRQGIEIEIRGQNALKPAHPIVERRGTRDTRHSLVVKDIRRQPHQLAGGFGFRVEGADTRVVGAILLVFRPIPGTVRPDLIFDGRRLAVHNSSLSYALLAVGAERACKAARLVAIAHPAQARVTLKEGKEFARDDRHRSTRDW